MADHTPSLDEFRKAYEADDNEWWMLASGDHMNLFDAALDALDEARARIAEVEAAQRPPLGYVAIADHEDGFIAPVSVAYPSAAECRASWAGIEMVAESAGYRVAELREIQP